MVGFATLDFLPAMRTAPAVRLTQDPRLVQGGTGQLRLSEPAVSGVELVGRSPTREIAFAPLPAPPRALAFSHTVNPGEDGQYELACSRQPRWWWMVWHR